MVFQEACSGPEAIVISAVKTPKYTVFIQDCEKLSCFCKFLKYISSVFIAGLS